MSYRILERLGDGVARVSYPGIDQTGFRNLLNDTTISTEVLEAVKPWEQGPPAYKAEQRNYAYGTQTVHRDLESGRFITEEEYNRRRQTPKVWRSSAVCDEDTKDKFGRTTNIKLEVFLVTRIPHEVSDLMDVWNTAVDIVNVQQATRVTCNPNIERPHKVSQAEVDGFGSFAYYTYDKAYASGEKVYRVDLEDRVLKGPLNNPRFH